MKRNLTADELKDIELGILDSFSAFCKENNYRWSLVGGSMLGAIRHKGFIPWDDDIDIAMPRQDYEDLLRNKTDFESSTGLLIKGHGLVDPHFAFFYKIVNPNIYVKEPSVNYLENAWIDIFPYDGAPDEYGKWRRLHKRAKFNHDFYVFLNQKNQYNSRSGQILKKILSLFLRSFDSLNCRISKTQTKLAKKIPFCSTSYIACITWGMYGDGERIPSDSFDNTTLVNFEGREVPIFYCWDKYLTGIYGDYMQLPPVEQQVNHGITAWTE